MSSKCSFIIFSCPWDEPSDSVAEVGQIIYKLLNLARLKKKHPITKQPPLICTHLKTLKNLITKQK